MAKKKKKKDTLLLQQRVHAREDHMGWRAPPQHLTQLPNLWKLLAGASKGKCLCCLLSSTALTLRPYPSPSLCDAVTHGEKISTCIF